MFGRIPRYVFRAFLAAFAITLVSVLALFVLVDLFTKIGDFVKPEREGLLAYMARYYLWHLPVIFAQVGPVVTLVGVAFALARLRRAGELLPVTASGMSLTRALGPVLLFAGALAAGSLALEEWGIPAAGVRIRSGGLTARGDRFQFDALVYDRTRRVLFFAGKYTPADRSAENVHLIEFDESGREGGRTFAWSAQALPGGGWRLGGGGYRHRYDADGRRQGTGRPERFDTLDYRETDLLPYDVELGGQEGRFRSLSGLAHDAVRLPDAPGPRVELHARVAHPLAHLALLLVGLPLVLAREARTVLLGPLLAGAVCGAYFVLQAVAAELGGRGLVPPALAGWAPVGIFAALGLARWETLPT